MQAPVFGCIASSMPTKQQYYQWQDHQLIYQRPVAVFYHCLIRDGLPEFQWFLAIAHYLIMEEALE